jgi:acid stress-induced BolA-like protein IbaG/YrbA
MSPKGQLIKDAIEAAVENATVHIYDPDGEHFEAFVISDCFKGMPLIKQHQLVMNALTERFKGMPLIKQHKLVMNALKERFATNEVHALALKTFTPEKWDAAKQNYT